MSIFSTTQLDVNPEILSNNPVLRRLMPHGRFNLIILIPVRMEIKGVEQEFITYLVAAVGA